MRYGVAVEAMQLQYETNTKGKNKIEISLFQPLPQIVNRVGTELL